MELEPALGRRESRLQQDWTRRVPSSLPHKAAEREWSQARGAQLTVLDLFRRGLGRVGNGHCPFPALSSL